MLTALQRHVARSILEASPDRQLALAGGAAMIAWGLVDRLTRDLDLFTPRGRIDELIGVLEAVLTHAGLTITPIHTSESFVRMQVSDSEEICIVDLALDPRLFPAVEGPLGRTLSLDELAADKMLALFGRAEPRDFIDVHALLSRFTEPRLLELAALKDSGFSQERFAAVLGDLDRFDAVELGLDDPGLSALRRCFDDWRRRLATPERG